MWILVLLALTGPNEVSSKPIGSFTSMTECFEVREIVLNGMKNQGYVGIQGICIQAI